MISNSRGSDLLEEEVFWSRKSFGVGISPTVGTRRQKIEKCRGCKEIGERGLETGPETVVCALRVRAKSSFLESDGSSVGVVSHAAVRRSPRKLEHERCRQRASRAM